MRKAALLALPLVLAAACAMPPPPPPGHPTQQCDNARARVGLKGDVLPDGWVWLCPGTPDTGNGFTWYIPSTGERGVVIGPLALDDNDGGVWLRYVVAHELCHARLFEGQEPGDWRSEADAEACNTRYGFPFPG